MMLIFPWFRINSPRNPNFNELRDGKICKFSSAQCLCAYTGWVMGRLRAGMTEGKSQVSPALQPWVSQRAGHKLLALWRVHLCTWTSRCIVKWAEKHLYLKGRRKTSKFFISGSFPSECRKILAWQAAPRWLHCLAVYMAEGHLCHFFCSAFRWGTMHWHHAHSM